MVSPAPLWQPWPFDIAPWRFWLLNRRSAGWTGGETVSALGWVSITQLTPPPDPDAAASAWSSSGHTVQTTMLCIIGACASVESCATGSSS